jgi:hypothetical protein
MPWLLAEPSVHSLARQLLCPPGCTQEAARINATALYGACRWASSAALRQAE